MFQVRDGVSVVRRGTAGRRRPGALRAVRRSIQCTAATGGGCDRLHQGRVIARPGTRADAILQSAEAVAPAEAAEQAEAAEPQTDEELESGVEIAQLQIIGPVDNDLSSETSLEFTLPPGELDRIFIETRPSALERLAITGRRADDWPAPPPAAAPATSPMGTDAAATPAAAPTPAPTRAAAPARTRLAGLEVSDVARQEMLESFAREELPRLNPPRRRLPMLAWSVVAVLLALLLAIQVIRGPRSGDAALHSSLSAYQLRQWGVTGDPGAKGTLRVRATIMNTSGQLQPYPLLRVTLANRFGTHVGQREFEPAEYLGRPTAQMLTPGQQLDATLDILDPGKDAEGFEIDVCVRGAEKKVLCAGETPAQTK